MIDQVDFRVDEKSEPFCLAVTNQAVYLPAKKLFAVSDPFFFRRVSHGQVKAVSIRALRPYGFWVLAAFMFVIGLATTILMALPFFSGEAGTFKISGWPLAILVGGIIMPFAARGRLGLVVKTESDQFSWKPPLVVDGSSKGKIEVILVRIAAACQKANLPVLDERKRKTV